MIPMIPLMPTAGLVDLLGPTTLLALGGVLVALLEPRTGRPWGRTSRAAEGA